MNGFDRRTVRRYAGSERQLFGIKSYTMNEGRATGVRAFDIDTGAGTRFTVLPDRCMDILDASFGYRNVVHLTKTGAADGRYYEPDGDGWLRTFGGGLLTTCGFSQIGDPMEGDEGYGLHGRLSAAPACEVCHEGRWKDGRYVMMVSGKMRDALFYGDNIVLRRTITATAGENRLFLRDEIENEGCKNAKVMLLYHMNFGYPLIDEGTEMIADIRETEAFGSEAEKHIARFSMYEAPSAQGKSLLYFHDIVPDRDGKATVILKNGCGGVYVRYDSEALPCLTQWKNNAEQDYVAGIEPGTGRPYGRSRNMREGRYRTLAPGESFQAAIEIGEATP